MTTANTQTNSSRRTLLKTAAAIAGSSVAGKMFSQSSSSESGSGGTGAQPKSRTIRVTRDLPVVETDKGKVRGYISEPSGKSPVYTFKGIPYAASTGGARRFMAPDPATPWTGVRSSLQYGNVSPQAPHNDAWLNDEDGFLFAWNDGVQGDDCLRVNIWTPGIDNRKRPVMVWMHGGGFMIGSGHELRQYDGENLARRGDAVIVTLSHRLATVGFLNLSAYGERFSDSGNAGVLDLVMALQWVKTNISAFGGDPSSVTIFGQSGGGAKVSTVMGMPAANGLYHRAIVQSGSALQAGAQEQSRALAARVLEKAGLQPSQAAKLQEMDYQKIVQLGIAATGSFMLGSGALPGVRMPRGEGIPGWGPVVDGKNIPRHMFDPTAPDAAANVPMLIGSTLNEMMVGIGKPDWFETTEADAKKRLQPLFGTHTDAVYAAFQKTDRSRKPYDMLSLGVASMMRRTALKQATVKSAQPASVYSYRFDWQVPTLDGRPMAYHGSEMAFTFDNTDRCASCTGGGEDARVLAARVSTAWLTFARTGNPNHPGLPQWPAFDPSKRQTMLLNNTSRVVDNPDGPALDAIDQAVATNGHG